VKPTGLPACPLRVLRDKAATQARETAGPAVEGGNPPVAVPSPTLVLASLSGEERRPRLPAAYACTRLCAIQRWVGADSTANDATPSNT